MSASTIQFYCLVAPIVAAVLIVTVGRIFPILYEAINASVAVITFLLALSPVQCNR